jgi:hypothetical protein
MSATAPPRGDPAHRDWLLVDAADPAHAEGVVAALCDIFATKAGRALLRPIHASGRAVRIVRPGVTAAPNAFARPKDLAAATAAGQPTGATSPEGRHVLGTGAGSDSVISFAAADWPNPTAPQWPSADAVLFALLVEAAAHVAGTARPAGYAEAGAAEMAGEALAAHLEERGLPAVRRVPAAPRAPR